MATFEKRKLHLFRTIASDRAVMFQIVTGFFFLVDELCEAVLKKSERLTRAALIMELSDEYDCTEVVDAIDELTERGLIYSNSAARQSVILRTNKQVCSDANPAVGTNPFHVTLHVAHACNIKCAYCFAHGGDYGGRPRFMEPEVARQAVHWALREAVPFGRCQIDFFGGEPLLNFELIRDVVSYARDYARRLGVQVSFGIATNGTVMSSEILEFFINEEFQVQISLDGDAINQNRHRKFHDGSDTYDVVAGNLAKLSERLPDRVSVHATMTSDNMDRKAIQDGLSQFGVCHLDIAPVVATPQETYAFREEHLPEMKQRLYELSRHETERILNGSQERGFFDVYMERLMTRAKACHGCQGGKTFLAVDVNGDIYFCSSLADRSEFKMGDVFSGLDFAVQEEFNESFHVDARSDCRRCWARNLCGGGCIYDAQTATGDPIRPNPVSCEKIRYSFELAMEMCLEIQDRDETLLIDRLNLKRVGKTDAN